MPKRKNYFPLGHIDERGTSLVPGSLNLRRGVIGGGGQEEEGGSLVGTCSSTLRIGKAAEGES